MARRNKHYLGPALAVSLLLHGSLLSLQFSRLDAAGQARGWLWGARQAKGPQGNLRVELRAAPRELSVAPATPLPLPPLAATQVQAPAPRPPARAAQTGTMTAQVGVRKTVKSSSTTARPQTRQSTPALASKKPAERKAAMPSVTAYPDMASAEAAAAATTGVARKPELEEASAATRAPEQEARSARETPDTAAPPTPAVRVAPPHPETAGPIAPAADELVLAARSSQERALEAQARAQAEEVRRQGEVDAQARRADAAADQLASALQRQALDELAAEERRQAAAEAAARQAALEEARRALAEEALRKERERQEVLRQQEAAAAQAEAEAERQREVERLAEQQRVAAELVRKQEEARRAAERLAAEQQKLREQARQQEAERQAVAQASTQAASAQTRQPMTGSPAGRPASSAALLRQALMNARQLDAPGQPRPAITAGAAEGVTHHSVLGRNPNEVQLSFYGDSWEDKLRRISNANYPRLPTGRSEVSLVVSVRIQADGQLEAVALLQGSGDSNFDAAVRRLIEMAAPFAAFPPDLRRAFATVELRRTLHFNGRPPLVISR